MGRQTVIAAVIVALTVVSHLSFHAGEVRGYVRAFLASRGPAVGSDVQAFLVGQGPSIGSPGTEPAVPTVAPAAAAKAIVRLKEALDARSSWAARFGSQEAQDDSDDEDEVSSELAAARTRLAQWRLSDSERHLQFAVEHAERWQEDLEADQKLAGQKRRAARSAVLALTSLGSFLEARGRPEDALPPLQRALKLARRLAPLGAPNASAWDLAAASRAGGALGRAQCAQGGHEGQGAQEAQRTFGTALQAAAEARLSEARGTPEEDLPGDHIGDLAALEAGLQGDLADCLHGVGSLAPALAAADAALRLARGSVGASSQPWLLRHLAAVRGGVLHDEGRFEDALELYDEYLSDAPRGLPDDPRDLVELFGVLQGWALAANSVWGRFDEASRLLHDVERLQASANTELRARVGSHAARFLRDGSPDPRLWASMATTLLSHAELMLEASRAAHRRPSSEPLAMAKRAVDMLRKHGREEDLSDALNTLGNTLAANGRPKRAQRAYQEGLKLTVKLHGAESPLAAAAYYNLGLTLGNQGETAKALELCRHSLEIQERELGPRNPDTMSSLVSVAGLLERQGRRAEAAVLARRAAAAARAALPEGHWLRAEAEGCATRLEAPSSGNTTQVARSEAPAAGSNAHAATAQVVAMKVAIKNVKVESV